MKQENKQKMSNAPANLWPNISTAQRRALVAAAVCVVFAVACALMRPALTVSADPQVTSALEGANMVLALNANSAAAADGAASDTFATPTQTAQLTDGETLTLGANATSAQATYQWEILNPQTGSWMDIDGATSITLDVTSALLDNALTSANAAQVRAQVTQAGQPYTTDTAQITVVEFVQPTPSDVEDLTETLTYVSDSGQIIAVAAAISDNSAAFASSSESQTSSSSVPADKDIAEPSSLATAESETNNGEIASENNAESSLASSSEITADTYSENVESEAQSEALDKSGSTETVASVNQECQVQADDSSDNFGEPGSTETQSTSSEIATLSLLNEDSDVSDDSANTYTVKVHYIDENGEIHLPNWEATFASSGQTAGYIITFTQEVGFTTKILKNIGGGITSDTYATALQLQPVISSDLDYYVVYEPAKDTKYKVQYRFEPVPSSEKLSFTEDEYIALDAYKDTEGEATTNTVASVTVPEVPGFKARPYNLNDCIVAADGNTVITIYYDRKYYEVSFENNEGVSTATDIYVRYERDITEGLRLATDSDKITRDGYSLVGWYTSSDFADGSRLYTPEEKEYQNANIIDANGKLASTALTDADQYMPTTMGCENVTYYARWYSDKTTFSVALWIESDNSENISASETDEEGSNVLIDNGYYVFLNDIEDVAGTTGDYVSIETQNVQEAIADLIEKGKQAAAATNGDEELAKVADLVYYNRSTYNYNYTAEGATPKSVRLEGDGSTTLNVYYDRNSYTLRFYYARCAASAYKEAYDAYENTSSALAVEQETGITYQTSNSNNGYSLHSQSTWDKNGTHEWIYNYGSGLEEISGGKAYNLTYGCDWQDSGTTIKFTDSYRKTILDNPNVLQLGRDKTLDSNYVYYYIDLTAKYKAEISQYWPMTGSITTNTTLIDWGTEYDSPYYEKYCKNVDNKEPNISPYWGVMDKTIIYRTDPTVSPITHSFVSYSPIIDGEGKNLYYWKYTAWYQVTDTVADNVTTFSYENSATGKSNIYRKGGTITVITTQIDHSASSASVVAFENYKVPTADDGTIVVTKGDNIVKGNNEDNAFELSIYYDLDVFKIVFFNGFDGKRRVENIPYNQPLGNYSCQYSDSINGAAYGDLSQSVLLSDIEPITPSASNWSSKYKWDGKWYEEWDEINETGTGDPVDFNTATMPNSNLLLYPGWEKVTYTAYFYLTENSTEPLHTETIYFEGLVTEPAKPANGNWEFTGWRYYPIVDTSNNMKIVKYEEYNSQPATVTKLAPRQVAFSTQKFTSDVYFYAQWSKNVMIDYEVDYVLADYKDDKIVPKLDSQGEEIRVADSTKGQQLAGEEVTVTALSDEALYEEYWPTSTRMYCPVYQNSDGEVVLESSTSIKMDIDASGTIVFKFYYIETSEIPYRVQYVKTYTDDDGNEKSETITENKYLNNKTIVTETAPTVSGYTLVAEEGKELKYQITRVLTVAVSKDADGNYIIPENNIIRFYYVENTSTANYTVQYWMQKTNVEPTSPDDYELRYSMEFPGEVNEYYSAIIAPFEGFRYDSDSQYNTSSGMLTSDGMVLNVYYNKAAFTLRKNWDSNVADEDVKDVVLKLYIVDSNGVATAVDDGEISLTAADAVASDGLTSDADAAAGSAESRVWEKTVYLPLLEVLDTSNSTLVPTGSYYVVRELDAAAGSVDFYSIVQGTQCAVQNNSLVFDDSGREEAVGQVEFAETVESASQSVSYLREQSAVLVVTNHPTYELPKAGGGGGARLYAAGAALIAGAGAAVWAARHRHRRRRC
jgi:hypothetical protein